MNKSHGTNGNGTTKGAQKCSECGLRTANPVTGLCFACETELNVQVCKVPGCNHIAASSGLCDLHELIARYEDMLTEMGGARR